MERIKPIKKPSLILTSDWHLREDTPTCWTGDFQMEQWLSVAFISKLQEQYQCPVIHAGDLFHHWKPSPWLLAQAIDLLPKQFHTIYGQHDLPQHSWELRGKSGINCLHVAGRINLLEGVHYGQEPSGKPDYFQVKGKNILVWHHMVFHKEKPYPDCPSEFSATLMIRKYPEYDLLLFGDNHQSFEIHYGGQILVNPGNLTRQTADQIDFQPRVALWYAEDNTIQWIPIPIKQGVITREHISKKEERDERLTAFIEKLDSDYEIGLSFEQNLEAHFNVNRTKDDIKKIIYTAIE